MKTTSFLARSLLALCGLGFSVLGWPARAAADAPELEYKPNVPFFAKFEPVRAPAPAGLLLKRGDRLAICGDSITEQKMYSRMLETYLTVCVPDLRITVRQYGWGGETAPGFLARMTNDCLRFKPTVATTCYGMNDHGYRAYEPAIGQRYRSAMTAVVAAFKNQGTRVVLGAPGCVGTKVSWSQAASEDMNLNLCTLRNLDIEIAAAERVRFADVFWTMFTAGYQAQTKYGAEYLIAGKDAVHPDWAGHAVMAYAFLKAFGLDGQIGSFTVDLAKDQATVSAGHQLHGMTRGELTVTSRRYPFCAAGEFNRDNSIRSAMTLVPFNADLNRLMLTATGGKAAQYRVSWGDATRSYAAAQLAQGVNLAEDFPVNPFSAAFKQVDEAVAAKQAYETRQIKTLFHGDEGKAEIELTAALTEKVRAHLTDRVVSAFVPVTFTLRIEPE
jgi:lysophospholipase L1-like esterase